MRRVMLGASVKVSGRQGSGAQLSTPIPNTAAWKRVFAFGAVFSPDVR